jgi:hypothetical protein
MILGAALIGDVLQSIKPKDALAFQGWPHPMTVSSFAAAFSNVWRGYVPIPRPFPRLLTVIGGSPYYARLIWGSNFLLDPAPPKLALGAILSLSLLALSAWTLRRSPLAAAWYWLGTGLMLLFHVVISGAQVRHDGLHFILYLACLWCGFTRGRDQTPRPSPRNLPGQMERFFLPSILALQVVAGVYAWTLHLLMPFSASKLAADFIRQHGYAHLLIMGSKEANVTPVTAYLDQPMYYPDSGRYGTFSLENAARRDLSEQELLQSVARMAMKAHGDTLLVGNGRFMVSHDGITQPLGSAWLGPDGSFYSLSGPPTERRMKMSLVTDFQAPIVDEEYSLYLISKP